MRPGRKPRGSIGPNHLLRREREKRGWSQSRLAELIGAASANVVSRWERGECGVDYVYQEKLCHLFGKNAFELGFAAAADGGTSAQLSAPFGQGRLLWTLHLGIEQGELKGMVSCPLADGGVFKVILTMHEDCDSLQQWYRLLHEQVLARLGRPPVLVEPSLSR
jgi:transcriptional regulator with XRE-family HTH domain